MKKRAAEKKGTKKEKESTESGIGQHLETREFLG